MLHCNTVYYYTLNLHYEKENCFMRQVINLSLPPEMSSVVTKEVKTGKYSSKSEFFRSLLRAWMEEKLIIELDESRKEIKEGKGKVLHSLKDLR